MTGYIYDVDGTRVSTGTITTWGSCDPTANGYVAMKDSILGPSGGQLTEVAMDSNGNMAWSHTNVWVGGQLLATYDPNGLHFYLTDWTGSRRVQTDYEGVVEQTCANLPYGDGVTCGANPTEQLFAGLERDSESGLDHAMFRQYSSTFGRWTSPDPYGGSISNPQSLNRYAYVNGSPLGASDPSGLYPCAICLVYNGGSSTSITVTATSGWLSTLLGYAAPFAFAADIFEIGKDFGLWDTGPTFHGNVAASQSGKYVPNAPQGDVALDYDIFHCSTCASTWNSAAWAVSPQGIATWYGASAVGAVGALGIGAVGGTAELTTLGLEAPAAATPGFGTTTFGTAMHAQFGEVLLEQTGTPAGDWIFAAPNAPGVDATYLGSENLGFNAAELKPVGFDMNAVGNQIGSFANQPGATSVWWYNSNGIIGDTGVIFH